MCEHEYTQMITSGIELDCLILAAGSASRFGGCKQLADWRGRSLLANSIATARVLEPARIFVVAGAFLTSAFQSLAHFCIYWWKPPN